MLEHFLFWWPVEPPVFCEWLQSIQEWKCWFACSVAAEADMIEGPAF